jgi:DNA-binding transcriptional LysR family regulator
MDRFLSIEPVSEALLVRRLFSWRGVFCATPAYLEAHGTPRKPADLLEHRLGLYSRYPTRDRWVFHTPGKGRSLVKTVIELKPVLRTNSVHLLRDYAESDAGKVPRVRVDDGTAWPIGKARASCGCAPPPAC